MIIIIPMAILGVLAIILFAMIVYAVEEDSKVWESPYDESLITENVVLDVVDDDVSSVLQAVEDFLLEKGESNKLYNISIDTDIETLSVRRYWLLYELEPIDIYTGYSWVYCFNIENEWVIVEAEKRYDDYDRKKEEPLNISDIEAIYEKNLKEMQKENFYGGYECQQRIARDEVTIRIFDKERDEHNLNVLIKRIKYDKEKDEYSIDYSK